MFPGQFKTEHENRHQNIRLAKVGCFLYCFISLSIKATFTREICLSPDVYEKERDFESRLCFLENVKLLLLQMRIVQNNSGL